MPETRQSAWADIFLLIIAINLPKHFAIKQKLPCCGEGEKFFEVGSGERWMVVWIIEQVSGQW